MSVGFTVDRLQVDQQAGALAQHIQQWAAQALAFENWLATMPDADLEAPPFDYAAADVALLKSAASDMATLANVFLGNQDLTPARDLSVFVRRIGGLLVSGAAG